MKDELFEQVKSKLNITWEDEGTNKRLRNIIESAIPDVIHILGISDKDFDFSADGIENTLFLAYCFYEWNHVLNEFEDNYSNKIAQVRQKYEVEHFLNSEESESE